MSAAMQAVLPTSMSGAGVHGLTALCPAAFCASILACWPTLKATIPDLAGHTLAASSLPLLRSFRLHYDALGQSRLASAASLAALDRERYVATHGEVLHPFRPKSLPRLPLPSPTSLDAAVAKADNSYKPPAQRKLSSVSHCAHWLAVRDAAARFDEAADARL